MGSRSKKGKDGDAAATSPQPPRLFCIRFTLFLLVVTLTALSLVFGYSLRFLYNQIETNNNTIASLQGQIANQTSIIARFNMSVTNADIEKHVQQLEDELHANEDQMKQSLQQERDDVQAILDKTITNLNQTVAQAEATIQADVQTVQKDVEKYVVETQHQFSLENHFITFQLAGTFCLLAILISMWHMTAHIRQFKRPFVQRKILAILWMCPIYAVTSWLSLVFPNFEGYLGIIKDFYEAYVIYQFLGFCISVLGRGDREEVVNLLAKHVDHLEPPMRFCGCCRGKYHFETPRALAAAVLLQCQFFAMQFVFFKPLTSVGIFACDKFDFCDVPNDLSVTAFGYTIHHIGILESPRVWLIVIQNISVFMAFSGLLKFYHAVQDDLAWCNPFPKFLCIKGIVFMTFWQGLVISILAEGSGTTNEDASKQAQNFLICLEMLLFSIAHFYCFPTEEWQEGYQPFMERKVKGISDNMAFGDFVSDLKLILRGSTSTEKKKAKKLEKKIDDLMGLKDDMNDDDDDDNNNNVVATLFSESDAEEGKLKIATEEETETGNLIRNKSDEDKETTDVSGEKNESMLNDSADDLDEEKMDSLLTESLRNSLSDRSQEVREAAHRLLRNRMVEVDRLSEQSGSRSGSQGSDDNQLGTSPAPDYGALSNEFHSEYTSMPPMGGGDGSAASETTSLLPKSGDGGQSMGALNNFG